MKCSLTQLNTTVKPQNPIPTITKTVLSLLCFLFLMLNDQPVSAQTNNCPNGEPLQWTWVQNLIEQSAGCVAGSIQQFEYNGDTYISVSPGSIENGYYCPSDHVFSRYTCQGDFICSFGAINGTGCDPDFENAARTGTTIWIYDDNLQASCNTHLGTFFYADCGGISYYFIELDDGRIFDPYFAVDPGFYPEEGQQIRFDFEIKTDVSTPCDISESPITITCFEEVSCPSVDPLQLDWIQEIIASSDGVSKSETRQFNYEGLTYYHIVNETSKLIGWIPLESTEFYYNCNGNFICSRGFSDPHFHCELPFFEASNNYTTIWAFDDQFANCSEGDPLQWTWIQNLIDQSSGCALGSIQQFTYNENTYIRTTPLKYLNDYPCMPDLFSNYYTCDGTFICAESHFFGSCNQEFANAADSNATTLWTHADNACDLPLDAGTCEEQIPRYYFNTAANVCQSFMYSGCGGNANNYETYAKCTNACDAVVSCPAGNPIEWDWVQEIINQGNICSVGAISLQEYADGNKYIVTIPGDEPAYTALGFPPLPPCDDHDPIITYNCQGQLICRFDPINFPTCSMGNLGQLVNSTLIWEYEPTGDESACALPVEEGICDNRSVRYYFDSDIGSCKQFVYNGCGGNANNYLTYAKCVDACNPIVNCPEGDPLEWDWIQGIINEENPCLHGSIEVWEYDNGNTYIKTFPGEYSFSTATLDGPWCNLSAVPKQTYTCQGQLLCEFEPVHFPYCYMGDLGTVVNSTTIWTWGDESNNCTYESTGTVYDSENCGLYIGCCLDSAFEPIILPEGFTLQAGQNVEFSVNYLNTDEWCLPLGIQVEITCIRVVSENCGCVEYGPVCGIDGNTYNSACLADCKGVEVAYEGNCIPCYDEDPLQAEWIKGLIINGEGCTVYQISQFDYNGATHFAVSPNGACVSDPWVSYYDCIGNLVCSANILNDSNCDSAITEASNAATTVWMYNEAGCANPLETDFVQEWINGDCIAESIYSFEFEGETFIYVEPNGFCDIFYDDYQNYNDYEFLYNCNTGITCNPVGAYYYYEYSCYNISESFFIESALTDNNLIWTKPCEYELTGEVIHIGDVTPIEYVNDQDCDLIINVSINGQGFTISPISLPDGFTLTLGQIVELSFRHTFNVPESACTEVSPVEIICIREAGGNQNNMDRIECPQDHTTSICAPVSMPPSMTLQDFSTTDDPNYMNSMSLQMEEQTDVQANFNTTARIYTITDEAGNQKTCQTKHYIANQFLQMPEVAQPGTVCEEDLWSYVKIGIDQYKIYADNNGAMGNEMSTCNTPNLICSTVDFGVDTKVPNQYNFWATTYFEFPDGTMCESEPAPFYVDVQAKPVATLSAQNKTVNLGEGIELMDLVSENKSGYWSGENILYLMTATGENIAYFSANETGVYKLYYTVRNENCERSYLMVVEVASAGKVAATQASYKTLNTAFNIYPNPTSNKVFIDLPDEAIYQINLLDISGKMVKAMKTELDQSTAEIEVSDLPKGMYLVAVANETEYQIKKLLIE